MGPKYCSETSVENCHCTLRNISEERKSQQLRVGCSSTGIPLQSWFPFSNRGKYFILRSRDFYFFVHGNVLLFPPVLKAGLYWRPKLVF
jgi:hypothetical protein